MSKKCQNCGFELADKMNFCPQCHAKYEAPTATPPPPQTAFEPPKNQKPTANKKTIVLIVSAIVVVVVALVAVMVVWIVIASTNDSSPSVEPPNSIGESEYWEIVKLDPKYQKIEKEFSNFKYEKNVVVNDNYVLVCGYATVQGKGERQVSFHLKKTNGRWKLADWEDNWAPKYKFY